MNSGLIEVQNLVFLIAVSLSSSVAFLTDLFKRKIYNALTFPMIFTGLLFHGILGDFFTSLGGAGLALGLFGVLFALGIMGAGDVKYAVGLGAWGGSPYLIEVLTRSLLLGGLWAFISLVVSGRIWNFLYRMKRFLLSLYLSLLLPESCLDWPQFDKQATLPFGVPLALAAVGVAYSHG